MADIDDAEVQWRRTSSGGRIEEEWEAGGAVAQGMPLAVSWLRGGTV